jgi:hypothetical protein
VSAAGEAPWRPQRRRRGHARSAPVSAHPHGPLEARCARSLRVLGSGRGGAGRRSRALGGATRLHDRVAGARWAA